MTRLTRNLWASILLALSDFIGFTIAIYIAIVGVKVFIQNGEQLVHDGHINDWITFHVFLGICCVGWYSIRLRHYFYRKTFWFELKEILRTLIIFAVIEIAVMAFAKEGANKQVISSQADSLIKISRIWADFFPVNTSNQPI